MEKTKKLNIITAIVLVGFIIAIIYHFILGTIFHLEYPFNTFLFIPKDRFTDFTDIYKVFMGFEFNPYAQFHNLANRFPFGMFFLYLFNDIPMLFSFLLFYSIFIMYFVFYNYKNIKKNLSLPDFKSKIIFNTFVISFLSYPFLFWFDRGNDEGFLFIFLSLFIYFFSKEKYTKSAFLLALPVAIKGTPLIFMSLLLGKKKFKECFYCVLFAFLLTLVPLFLMKGSMLDNIINFIRHMKLYAYHYVIHNGGFGFGTSIFSIIKFIIFWVNGCIQSMTIPLSSFPFDFKSFYFFGSDHAYKLVAEALSIFSPVAALISLFIVGYVIFIEKVFWKQCFLLIASFIVFAPVSADYKLLEIYIPLLLFINAENKSKLDLIYAIMFGLILIPKNYIQFIPIGNPNFFSASILINPLILICMMVLIIYTGLFRQKVNLLDKIQTPGTDEGEISASV